MSKYYFSAFAAILLTSFAQVILKKGAILAKKEKKSVKSYFNFYSILAYGLFVCVTLLSLFAMKRVLIKEMVMFLPFTYIIIPVLSKFFLNETITKDQLYGILIIVIGVIIFILDSF